MQRTVAVALALAAFDGSPGFAQSVRASDDTRVQQELLRLNTAVSEMVVRKDVAVANRLLADDYVFVQAVGQVSNKAQEVAVIGDPAFVCESLTTDGVVVRVYGDAAVITGRVVMRATYRGKDQSGEFLYTDVWVRRQGRWQTVSSQATFAARRQ